MKPKTKKTVAVRFCFQRHHINSFNVSERSPMYLAAYDIVPLCAYTMSKKMNA